MGYIPWSRARSVVGKGAYVVSWDLKEPECLSQARLMVDPEFVYEQLKFYGDNIGGWERKEELEKLLLKRRLIPLSQVDQYLGLAGRIGNGAGFDFFGRS
jgi:hypothetical protein